MGMAEVVKPYSGHVRCADAPPERLAEDVGVDVSAIRLREHEIEVSVARVDGLAFLTLSRAMLVQQLDGPGVEVDDALAAVSLGVALLHVVAHRHERAPDGQASPL